MSDPTLARTKRLLLAALRVWELKQEQMANAKARQNAPKANEVAPGLRLAAKLRDDAEPEPRDMDSPIRQDSERREVEEWRERQMG